MITALILFTHLVTCHAAETPPEWIRHARQLIGENQGTREQAITELKQVFIEFRHILPELEGEYRNYALDVAVALKLPRSVEGLLPMVENDRDGSLTLAVNALMDDRTYREIAKHYTRILEKKPLHSIAVPVLMAMVDYLTHLRMKFEDDLFSALLAHPRLEVQQAAALHFAVLNKKGLTKLIKKNMKNLFPQVRAQILLTFYDLKEIALVRKACAADEDPIVKSACSGLDLKEKQEKRGKRKQRKRK